MFGGEMWLLEDIELADTDVSEYFEVRNDIYDKAMVVMFFYDLAFLNYHNTLCMALHEILCR